MVSAKIKITNNIYYEILSNFTKIWYSRHNLVLITTKNLITNKTYFNWSTGKDSALALYYLLQDSNYQVTHLLTAVNKHYDRVSMHGLRRELMLQQINALGISFSTIELPEQPGMIEYETLMKEAVLPLIEQGFTHAAFGDIFLEDLKSYREQQLAAVNLKAVFPIWKRDTKQLLREFISLGFKAILICVNASKLDQSFIGRVIDDKFIDDLPEDVDPCGENGEYHTFCFDGPIFRNPIAYKAGAIVYREYDAPSGIDGNSKLGFWFCDLF
ncbi:MAG: ATP-binding protein [Pedobacter sp.]|jgi:uncharacterized protein (TIGR00290 family)|nr:ATP-binding protein [Pedobacter sp.]